MANSQRARRDFLIGLTGGVVAAGRLLSAASARRAHDAVQDRPSGRSPQAARAPTWMYVGSFTGEGRGHGEGLSVFHRAGDADRWQRVQLLKDLADPSFVITDRQARCLYSAHGEGTQATAYRIDPASGRLSVLNQQPTGGRNGVHLAIDASGRALVLANYATGTLALLAIEQDGSLGPRRDLATLTGTPGPHRTQQESSHPHDCPFDRTGRFVVVPDKGLDKVFLYRVDAAAGTLVAGTPPAVATRAGAGPRHVAFHPTQPYLYVINELDSTIAVYRFDPDKALLEPIQVHTSLPSSHTGNNTCAEIAVAPSGRFVYGSNRGHDSIAIFGVDQATGLLTSIGWEPTQGKTPRFFALDPPATHLYAANQTTDTVVIFRIDAATGKLTATGEKIDVASPTTIAFR